MAGFGEGVLNMPQVLATAPRKLGSKLVAVVVGFTLCALVAIGFTLLLSWQLEGGAAAVNQAGSERMRAYRIAMLLSQAELPRADRQALYTAIDEEVAVFESSMRLLETGDPGRPMFLPGNARIQADFSRLRQTWYGDMKPAIAGVMTSPDQALRERLLFEYRQMTEAFVGATDRLVHAIEKDISSKTSLLRTAQLGLIWMAIIGTVALIYLMYLLVVRPVNRLEEGIQAMEAGDFDTRLPVESRDEFGVLAAAFNRMAARLKDLYRNLEAKVAEKTQSLELQNRELGTLYEVAALLNRPGTLEDLCRDFLRKLMKTLGADGGAVRLIEEKTGEIHLYLQEDLSPGFARDEACLLTGECLCGEAAKQRISVVKLFSRNESPGTDRRCHREGYAAVSVFSIQFKNQVLGVFNLFFYKAREFGESERLMLEALGRHLGVAIENQRLVAREKEMAVSEERNLLAQELHDSIAQSLAFLNLQAQMLDGALRRNDLPAASEGLGQMREGIQESYDDVRELLVHFRTRFGQSDVETAVRRLLDRFESDTGIETAFRQSGTGVALSPEIQIQALHIVQECLSNARKHSGAKKVAVELDRGPVYVFRVIDDGCGFEATEEKQGHVGLAIMRERAQRIGGRVAVESQPGAGTRITLIMPMMQEEAA
ncbi:MAG TPA: type IV pili methyl-accepting chemotaxis transducer N-terminal domain-containing protein [Burkholderiales bacterium]|nr:type IV pili methyl-accepting chemotaxis transducer N-terminal domain-containing protein [Burkholderiales bacterium]